MGAARSETGNAGKPETGDAREVAVLVDVAPPFHHLIDQSLLERAVRAGLVAAQAESSPMRTAEHEAAMPVWPRAEVGVRVTDDTEMQRLNVQYRGVDKPTDVLSFSFVAEDHGPRLAAPPDWPTQLGEIALSYPYAERQASHLGHSVQKELAWLTIHGTLQLLGYTHYTEEEAVHMEALEQRALQTMGL